jgi:hypothetical protein
MSYPLDASGFDFPSFAWNSGKRFVWACTTDSGSKSWDWVSRRAR